MACMYTYVDVCFFIQYPNDFDVLAGRTRKLITRARRLSIALTSRFGYLCVLGGNCSGTLFDDVVLAEEKNRPLPHWP